MGRLYAVSIVFFLAQPSTTMCIVQNPPFRYSEPNIVSVAMHADRSIYADASSGVCVCVSSANARNPLITGSIDKRSRIAPLVRIMCLSCVLRLYPFGVASLRYSIVYFLYSRISKSLSSRKMLCAARVAYYICTLPGIALFRTHWSTLAMMYLGNYYSIIFIANIYTKPLSVPDRRACVLAQCSIV